MQPLISIIIPIYNVEPYLHQCIDSVIVQTYTNLEIILIDDGSSDRCPSICDEYAIKDSRIKVVHKENGGLSSARNAGLDIAEGEYIYFLDSDDYIGPDTINILYKAFQTDIKIAIAIGYFTALHNDYNYKVYQTKWIFKEPQIIKPHDFALRMLSEQSNFAATAKLYKKSLLETIRFQPNKKNEDTLFTVDIIPLIESQELLCIDVPNYTYYYRQRIGSICHSLTDPLEWHSISNYEDIVKKLSSRKDIIKIIRKRQYELSILLQAQFIKGNKAPLLLKNQEFFYKIPNKFIWENCNFSYFAYFILIKKFPNLLKKLSHLKKIFHI